MPGKISKTFEIIPGREARPGPSDDDDPDVDVFVCRLQSLKKSASKRVGKGVALGGPV
jgi:hypothetical protein